jgi:AbrB family looped-hinge helix DNA binding protein
MTSKGQVTIPREIRTALKINVGDEISFELITGNAVLKKKEASIENIKNYKGYLKHLNGKNPDVLVEEIRGTVDD